MKLRDFEDWMTTGQAARKLDISRQRVLAMADDGRIRAVLVGKNRRDLGRAAWIFDPKDVERYASERGKP